MTLDPEMIRELFEVHNGVEAKAARQFRADIFDPRRRWAKKDGFYRLSDRLWEGSKSVRKQINDVLREAIRTGEDSLIVADKLEQFLSPDFSPVRLKSGKYKPNQARSIVTRSPGRGGMGSFPARRLARTELSRVHFEATRWAEARTPFSKGLKWNLSGRHGKSDQCDINANTDTGLGKGVYKSEDFPRYPDHPQDICHVSISTVDDVDAIVKQLRAEYGLDEV